MTESQRRSHSRYEGLDVRLLRKGCGRLSLVILRSLLATENVLRIIRAKQMTLFPFLQTMFRGRFIHTLS